MSSQATEFQPETWKTKSMKLGKGVGNAAVSGAVGAKNMTVSGAKSLKEKDWKKKEQPAPKPGVRNSQVGQEPAKAGGAAAMAKGTAAKTGTAMKNGTVSLFGAMKRGVSSLNAKQKDGYRYT